MAAEMSKRSSQVAPGQLEGPEPDSQMVKPEEALAGKWAFSSIPGDTWGTFLREIFAMVDPL